MKLFPDIYNKLHIGMSHDLTTANKILLMLHSTNISVDRETVSFI